MRILIVALFILVAMIACVSLAGGGVIWLVNNAIDTAADEYRAPAAPTWSPESAELTLAVSPVMAPVMAEIADAFNQQELKTEDGQKMRVRPLVYEPEKMVRTALDQPEFQAMSPDSSLWLERLEQAWAAQAQSDTADDSSAQEDLIPMGRGRLAEQTRYAVSPIVVAAWEEVARE